MNMLCVFGFLTLFVIAYKREEEINRFFSRHSALQWLCPAVVLLLITILFSSQLSLSPIANEYPKKDSAVFLYMGKALLDGAVPYRDLFDHKGVLLYFINGFGYLIGFGRMYGVWIIEIINLFAAVLIFHRIIKLFTNSNALSFFTIYLVLQLCSLPFFEGGNLVEEYALPWIALSLYFVVKFFVSETYKMIDIVLIGTSFAIVFFLRVNMVGLWGALLLPVVFHFLHRKKLMDLVKCALCFLVGCLIVIIPIFIYLIMTHSLQDMIDCYFVFNLSYTGSKASILRIVKFALECIDLVGLAAFFLLYSFAAHPKNKIVYLNLFALALAFLSSAISGRPYHHYGIIFIPFFVIPACLTLDSFMEMVKDKITPIRAKRLLAAIAAICFLCIVCKPLYDFSVSKKTSAESETTAEAKKISDYLIHHTTEEDDVLILGNKAVCYLAANRHTNNKFFYQEPPIETSDALYETFLTELKTKPSDYIVDAFASEAKSNERKNYDAALAYLNEECEKGTYSLESHDGFQVYVREK